MADEGQSGRESVEPAERLLARIYEGLFSQTLTSISIFDRQLRFVRVNAVYARHFGKEVSDFVGLDARKFYLDLGGTEAIADERLEWLRGVLTSKKPWVSLGVPFRFPDQPDRGETNWDITVQPILDEAGESEFLCWTAYEVTERVRAEAEVRALNRDLEKRVADRTADLESFAYSVSHDLRAPLRHVEGFLDLVLAQGDNALAEESLHHLKTARSEAKRMGTLIEDLLEFSRMGRCELSARQVDLGALVADIVRELHSYAPERQVCWQIGDLPVIRGDESMLRLVFVNLLSNALKFTRPRGEAVIEVGALPPGGGEAVLFVRDNGVGFDPRFAARLFGVFERLHRADEFEGTGIGLAIVRRIVVRHGGRAWAESELGRGSTFWLSLPLPR